MTANLKEEYEKLQISNKFNLYEIQDFLKFYGIENTTDKLISIFNKAPYLFHHTLNNIEYDIVFEFFQKSYSDKTLMERFSVYSRNKFCIGTLKHFLNKAGILVVYQDIITLLKLKGKIYPNSLLTEEQVQLILTHYETDLKKKQNNSDNFYIDIFDSIQTIYQFSNEETELLKKFFNGGRYLKKAVFETIKHDFA